MYVSKDVMKVGNIAGLVFILILLYLLLAPTAGGEQTSSGHIRSGEIINSLSGAGVNTILALQGRYSNR